MEIAVGARQGQIIEPITAVVLSRDDVLDVKCNQRRIALRAMAILAALSGSFTDRRTQFSIH